MNHIEHLKRSYKVTYLWYMLTFIVIICTVFFLTSNLFTKENSVLVYERNTVHYSNKIAEDEANSFLEVMKRSGNLKDNTQFKMYLSKNSDDEYLIMITEDTFNFSDDDKNLESIAKTLAEDLNSSVEFGKCTNEFEKIKSIKCVLNN